MDKLIKLTIAAILAVTFIQSEASARKKAPQNINKAAIVLDRVQACEDKFWAGIEKCSSDYADGTKTQMESCKAEQNTKRNLCEIDAHRSIQ